MLGVIKEFRWLFLLLLANVLLSFFYVAIGRDSLEVINRSVVLLLIIPILLAVSVTNIRVTHLLFGVLVGVFLTFFSFVYSSEVLGNGRHGSQYNPNPYSEVVFVSVTFLLCYTAVYAGWKKLLILTVSAAGFYCVLLSQTRGTFLAVIPVVMVFILFLSKRKCLPTAAGIGKHKVFVIFLVLSSLLVGFGGKFGENVTERVGLAFNELVEHRNDRANHTSVGIRLELWYGSWLSFKQSPITGIGSDDRYAYLNNLEEQGVVYLDNIRWRHNHSDYFDSLQRFGLPAMLIVIGIYLVLFRYYWRRISSDTKEIKIMALAGVLFITSYITFSLTEVPLRNSLSLVFFVVLNGALLGLLNKHDAKHNLE